jgi:hypothetical protein
VTEDEKIGTCAEFDLSGSGAVISPCGMYRYRLDRHVGAGPIVAAVFGVNGSTAGPTANDHTVRKWLGFGERLGWKRLIVGNPFGWRATDVSELGKVADPVGPENARYLAEIIAEADVLVACWGRRSKLPRRLRPELDRLAALLRSSGKPVLCWGRTAGGDPIHPLTLGYSTPLVAFAEDPR